MISSLRQPTISGRGSQVTSRFRGVLGDTFADRGPMRTRYEAFSKWVGTADLAFVPVWPTDGDQPIAASVKVLADPAYAHRWNESWPSQRRLTSSSAGRRSRSNSRHTM